MSIVKKKTQKTVKVSSFKSKKIKKEKPKSKIIPHEKNAFQRHWLWSPNDDKVIDSKLPIVLRVRDLKEKINVDITAAKSQANLEISTAFVAVFQEKYTYFLNWTPLSIFDKSEERNFIIGMCSSPFVIQKHLPTITEWNEELHKLITIRSWNENKNTWIYQSNPNIEIYNALDLNMISCSMQLIVYDPLLLQAVDATIERLKKKESKLFLDTLGPPMGEDGVPPWMFSSGDEE